MFQCLNVRSQRTFGRSSGEARPAGNSRPLDAIRGRGKTGFAGDQARVDGDALPVALSDAGDLLEVRRRLDGDEAAGKTGCPAACLERVGDLARAVAPAKREPGGAFRGPLTRPRTGW